MKGICDCSAVAVDGDDGDSDCCGDEEVEEDVVVDSLCERGREGDLDVK